MDCYYGGSNVSLDYIKDKKKGWFSKPSKGKTEGWYQFVAYSHHRVIVALHDQSDMDDFKEDFRLILAFARRDDGWYLVTEVGPDKHRCLYPRDIYSRKARSTDWRPIPW